MSRRMQSSRQQLKRRVVTVLGLSVCLLTPQLASGAAVSRQDAIKAYAPLVYLWPFGDSDTEERHRPMDARTFVSESNLRWSHEAKGLDGCDDEVAGHGPKPRLGLKTANPYTHRQGCDHDKGTFKSTQFTRPRDGDSKRVTDGVEGFFLDPDEDILDGTGTSAPVYYQFEAGQFITYWLFYPYSEPVGIAPDVAAHQGDWERISVKLNSDNRATDVAYYAHDGYCVQEYRKSGARYRGHPKVFVGHGSHASYSTSGRHGSDVTTANGPKWKTYQKLRNVENETFYGYGGAWGEVGNFSATTGPTGPSKHKSPQPGNWSSPGC